MSNVREERIKLFAIYLNTMAAGLVIAGVVAPAFTIVAKSGLNAESVISLDSPLANFMLISVALSLILHISASFVLRRLAR